MTAASTPEVTVAVVSWNTRDLLAACLRSLESDVAAGRAEVWVVDNASSDGSADLVDDRFPWTRLIRAERNIGFGAAVNEVALQTRSPWLAPSNADVELVPGALAKLLESGREHPDAAILAPRLVLPDGSTQHSVHSFPSVPLASIFGLNLQRLVPGLGNRLCLEGYWDPDRPRPVPWAHAAFLAVRREAFDAVGGFDAGQWLYAEDIDLAWRLARRGHGTRYVPDAIVRHAVSAATTRAFADERLDRHMAAAQAWMMRRRGALTTWSFCAVHCAGAAARAALLTPLARTRPTRWARPRSRALRYLRLHARGLRSRSAVVSAGRAAPPAGSEGSGTPPSLA